MDALNSLQNQMESLPGYSIAMDWFNEKAEEKYQTKDPFYVEIHGKKKRRKAPESCTREEQKAWKRIKKRAWLDDRNFFGCYPMDFGFGLAPLASLIPVIGPILMFGVHGRLITIADREFRLPPELVVKMHGNIVTDLIITLVPILGCFFSWMNACSTRNAALIHTYLVKREMKRERQAHEAQNQYQNIRVPNLNSGQTQKISTQHGSQHTEPSQVQKQNPQNVPYQQIRQPQQAYSPPTTRGRQMV